MILALLSLCFVFAVVSPLRAADVSIAEWEAMFNVEGAKA